MSERDIEPPSWRTPPARGRPRTRTPLATAPSGCVSALDLQRWAGNAAVTSLLAKRSTLPAGPSGLIQRDQQLSDKQKEENKQAHAAEQASTRKRVAAIFPKWHRAQSA